jgi:PAS domain S-box-containing protein
MAEKRSRAGDAGSVGPEDGASGEQSTGEQSAGRNRVRPIFERDDGDIDVLHVDDDPALLDVTEQYLRREDDRLAVETATSPADGLDLLAERAFDVVVSDYQMPDIDGLEFLERLRERGDDVPFIIFTGRGREEVAVEALNLGADRYLQKGGDPQSQYGLLADAIVAEATHQRARETLRESEERYRRLVEAFPDIVFITDYDSKMLWANAALERQTGLTIEDFQMDQQDNPFIHPDDADRVAAHIGEFVESDATYSEPIDNRFVDADGDVHWYSSIITKTTYDGEPALQFITRNISDRKEREQRRRRTERRYRTLVEHVPGLVALFDDDLRYDAVGGDLLEAVDLTTADVEGAHVAAVGSVLGGVDPDDCRAVFDGEHRERTYDAAGRTVTARYRPVTDTDGVTAGMVLLRTEEPRLADP